MSRPITSRVLLICLCCFSRWSLAGESLKDFGSPLATNGLSVEFKVPAKAFKRLPKQMNTYLLDTPTPFSRAGIEAVIQASAIDAQIQENLIKKISDNPALLQRGEAKLLRDSDTQFVVSPDSGIVLFRTSIPDDPVSATQQIPTAKRADAFALDSFKKSMMGLFSKFDWKDAEIERKPNGDYFMQVADSNRFPNHGTNGLLYQRSVSFYRHINGYPLITTSFHKITLTRLANGEWREIFIHWPRLKPTEPVPVSYRSNDDLKKALQQGRLIWDYTNQIDPNTAGKMVITNIRLGYYQPKGSQRLAPALFLDADLKNTNGVDYAVIFLPL